MKKKTTYCLILIFVCSTLSGQIKTTIDLSSRNFEKSFSSTIELRSSGQIVKIYNDTLKKYHVTNEDIIKGEGDYTLFVQYKNRKNSDSLSYKFQVTKLAEEILIHIQFYQKKISKKITMIEGKVSVEKINKGSENIKLEPLNSPKIGNQVLFKLTNNSTDTIYGEELPGYFWGYLSHNIYLDVWTQPYFGTLDMNFAPQKPLAPDSSTISCVGSFGDCIYKKIGRYKFHVLYSTYERNNHGYKKYLETKTTAWWTNNCEFYKLEKEIEVKY